MKMRFDESRGVVVITVDCSILQEHTDHLRSRFQELLVTGKTKVVLDMNAAGYVSSMGLAVIVDAKNQLMKSSGDLRMAAVPPLVMNLLTITNLAKRIRVFETVDQAVASFFTES